jgi:hypothetical protein
MIRTLQKRNCVTQLLYGNITTGHSREAGSRSAGQGIHRLLKKRIVHYHFHNNPPLDPILSILNSIRIPLPKYSLHFTLSDETALCISLLPIRAMRPVHLMNHEFISVLMAMSYLVKLLKDDDVHEAI